jgi:hypothetical protein
MLTWSAFATANPDLAGTGERLLYQFGVGLAFLATVRKDGGPRVHPVCPILADRHLYVFVPDTSPKEGDLRRDGRYALQSFPEAKPDSDEFYLAGKAELVTDPAVRRAVEKATEREVPESETLFHLLVDRAMHTRWLDWNTPNMHPVHAKWRAAVT